MIQRKQTLWLLLAALVSAGVFYFPLYRGHIDIAGIDTLVYLEVGKNMPLLLMALVMTVLPLIAIAMFTNRKRQRSLAAVSGVATIAFISFAMMRVTPFIKESGISNDSYWIGMVLPFIGMVFLILAIMGINRDEKRIKSLDRLR
jgi:peptidoglycan/LPS O-acetylase OafA/YrhL